MAVGLGALFGDYSWNFMFNTPIFPYWNFIFVFSFYLEWKLHERFFIFSNLSLFKLIVGLLDIFKAFFRQYFKLLAQVFHLVRMIFTGKVSVGALYVFR